MTLNARLSESEKQFGLDLVEESNPNFIETMRSQARMFSRRNGSVTADELRQWYEENKVAKQLPEPTSFKAMGAVFRGKNWVCVGYKKTAQVAAHRRPIGVWTWVGD